MNIMKHLLFLCRELRHQDSPLELAQYPLGGYSLVRGGLHVATSKCLMFSPVKEVSVY